MGVSLAVYPVICAQLFTGLSMVAANTLLGGHQLLDREAINPERAQTRDVSNRKHRIMDTIVPSCNTDQGVSRECERKGK